jgi:hypothetical protein
MVTAAVALEYKHWNDGQRDEFLELVDQHPDFLQKLTAVKDSNKKLLEAPQQHRKNERQRKRVKGS